MNNIDRLGLHETLKEALEDASKKVAKLTTETVAKGRDEFARPWKNLLDLNLHSEDANNGIFAAIRGNYFAGIRYDEPDPLNFNKNRTWVRHVFGIEHGIWIYCKADQYYLSEEMIGVLPTNEEIAKGLRGSVPSAKVDFAQEKIEQSGDKVIIFVHSHNIEAELYGYDIYKGFTGGVDNSQFAYKLSGADRDWARQKSLNRLISGDETMIGIRSTDGEHHDDYYPEVHTSKYIKGRKWLE